MVARAQDVQPSWERDFSTADRVDMLKAGLKALGLQTEALASLITAEMGKVQSEARDEAEGAVSKDAWLARVADANRPSLVGAAGGAQAVLLRDAMGVVVVLAPWNFPADEILLLALPALVAGNCVVVKPSEVAPLTGQMVVDALCTSLPAGVLQVAQGDGAVLRARVYARSGTLAMPALQKTAVYIHIHVWLCRFPLFLFISSSFQMRPACLCVPRDAEGGRAAGGVGGRADGGHDGVVGGGEGSDGGVRLDPEAARARARRERPHGTLA
jgi:hypothetical protein